MSTERNMFDHAPGCLSWMEHGINTCNCGADGRPTPTPARSEADTTEWGEPKPDCPRCHGTGTYRSLLGARLRTRLLACPCGLSDPARSEAAGGEALGEALSLATETLEADGVDGTNAALLASTVIELTQEVRSLRQQLAAAREDARGDFFSAISAIADAMDVAANGPNKPRHRRSLHAVAVPMNEILKAMQLCEANDAAGSEPGGEVLSEFSDTGPQLYAERADGTMGLITPEESAKLILRDIERSEEGGNA